MILWIVLGLLTTISGHECPNRSLIEKSLLEVHIPGAVMIVVNTTDILYQEAFGHQSFLPTQRMDADRSIFLLASISKTFIAVAAMQLVESGRVQLDADVNQYLLPTDPRIVHPSHPSSAITLRQLLSHSASIGSNEQVKPYFFFPDDDGLVKTTLADACFSFLTGSEANWLPYAPGTVTLYSNVGTGLAGLIVERVTGVSFERYVRANILKPLEIETAFRLSDVKERVDLVRHYSYGSSNYDRWKSLMPRLNVTQLNISNWLAIPLYSLSMYPAGLLRMSGTSLSKYLRMFMSNGSSLIRPESVVEMKVVGGAIPYESVNRSSDGSLLPSLEFGLAWNWQTLDRGRRFLGHGGTLPGATNSMLINERADTGVIVLTNADIYPNNELSIKIYQTINRLRLALFDCFEG